MMTWLADNKTKLLGTLTTIVAAVLAMIALGMFDKTADDVALIAPHQLRWLTVILSILNVTLGGGTIAAGVANSGNVRVEEAKARVATAMETAIQSTPPPTP
jgi:predicted tellurium resistance membrane protein TerC